MEVETISPSLRENIISITALVPTEPLDSPNRYQVFTFSLVPNGTSEVGAPIPPPFIGYKKPHDFIFPVCTISDISGLPAVKVQVEDIVVDLTNDELYRYVNYKLYPEEFLALRDKFGIHSMISNDYYEDDGEQLWDYIWNNRIIWTSKNNFL